MVGSRRQSVVIWECQKKKKVVGEVLGLSLFQRAKKSGWHCFCFELQELSKLKTNAISHSSIPNKLPNNIHKTGCLDHPHMWR